MTRTGPSGALLILVATGIAGGTAYLLMPVVAANLGAVSYAAFAVFWSGLYLAISGLSGIQQEITRAVRPRSGPSPAAAKSVSRNFGALAALAVLLVTCASAPLWISAVFPSDGWALVIPLAVGLVGYVIVAVVSGVLYGLRVWRFIAVMVVGDGLLRVILVLTVLSFTHDLALIAWAVVAPFLIMPLAIWPFVRARLVAKFELDVGYRSLSWNVARTVAGSAATGVLVSGFPLLLGATSGSDSPESVGALVLAITLTRAPIVIAVLSLQSYLVMSFRSQVGSLRWSIARLLFLIAAGTALLAVLAYWLGTGILATVAGAEFALAGSLLAALVGSAGLVAALCVTGPALLSRARHMFFTTGWLVAAAVTILLLLIPGDLEARAVMALSIGPACGLAVHFLGLVRRP